MAQLVNFKGQTFSFSDDVPEDVIASTLDKAQAPAEWSDVIAAVPTAVKAGLAKTVAGAIQLPEVGEQLPLTKALDWLTKDILPARKLPENIDEARAVSKRATADVAAVTPQNMTLPQEMVLSGLASLPESALYATAGGVGGAAKFLSGANAIEAALFGTNTALGAMTAGATARKFGEARAEGKSVGTAVGQASIEGAAELGGELFSNRPFKEALTHVLETGKMPGLKKYMAQLLGREVVGEELTTAVEFANDLMHSDEKITVEEAAQRLAHQMAVTAGSVGLSGPLQTGAFSGATKLAQLAVQRPQDALPTMVPESTPGGANTEPMQRVQTFAPSGQNTPDILADELPFMQRLQEHQKMQTPEAGLVDALGKPVTGVPKDTPEILQQRGQELSKELVATPALLQQVAQEVVTATTRPSTEDLLQLEVATELSQNSQFLGDEKAAQRRGAELAAGDTTQALAEESPHSIDRFVATPKPTLDALFGPAVELGDRPGWKQVDPFDPGRMFAGAKIQDPQFTALVGAITQPDGSKTTLPFEQALAATKPGDVVFLRDSTHQRDTADERLLGEALDMYKGLLTAFMPEVKLGVTTLDVPGARAFTVPHGADTLVIGIPAGASGGKLNFATLVHEFGHALHLYLFHKATPIEREALIRDYHQTLMKLSNVSLKDGMKLLAAPRRVAELMSPLTPAQRDMPFFEGYALITQGRRQGSKDYYLRFSEYLAEQFVKYYHTRGGVVQEAAPLFKRMLNVLAQMYYKVKGYTPTETFAQFMDNVILQNKASNVATPKSFAQLKQQLVAQGVHPELVDAMRLPGSEAVDMELAAQLVKIRRESSTRASLADVVATYDAAIQTAKVSLQELPSALHTKQYTADWYANKIAAAVEKEGAVQTAENIRDFVKSPLYAGKNVDGAAFIATLLSRVGNWRVLREAVTSSTSGDVLTVEYTVGDPRARMAQKLRMRIRNSVVTNIDLGVLSGESADLAGFVALQALARNGVAKVARSALNETHVALQQLLESTDTTGSDYYDVPYWAYNTATSPEMLFDIVPKMAQVGRAFGFGYKTANQMARFNKFMGWTFSAFQIAKMNAHVPGVSEMQQALRNRMWYKTQWTRQADKTLEKWTNGLRQAEREAVAKLLYTEAADGDAATSSAGRQAAFKSTRLADPAHPGRYVFQLKPGVAKAFGLSQKGEEVYSAVRADYMASLDEMEKVGLTEIAHAYMDPTVTLMLQELTRKGATREQLVQQLRTFVQGTGTTQGLVHTQPKVAAQINAQIKDMLEQFQHLREKPYTPYPRFGQFAVVVRHPTTKAVVHFETFESKIAQASAAENIAKSFPGMVVARSYIEDLPYTMAGLPQAFLTTVAKTLDLTQSQLDSYREMQLAMSHANSFVKSMMRRKGTAGYSEDAVRGYAEYMRRFANHQARVKAAPEISAALQQIATEADRLSTTHEANANAVHQLHEYYSQTAKYLSEPGAEMGAVKSLVSLFHFGFNIASAVTNSLQVPMVTLPYLAERHGWLATTKELKRGYADLRHWTSTKKLEPDVRWALDHGLDVGFLDESFATTLAQTSDGSVLTKFAELAPLRRGIARTNHYAMWMFQKAEEINRRVSFVAAFRFAKRDGLDNTAAFDYARSTVETTQGEYAQENRPKFMRGNWSLVFQFMQYQQMMLFNMLGGDASWKKMLMLQLFLGGIMGMPFAEDAKNLAKFMARKMGLDEPDLEKVAREHLTDLHVNAELILRGLSSNVFGFDLSQRISLGDVVPGMRAVGSNQKLNDVMRDGVGDIMGPGFSLLLNAIRFISEDDPRTLEHILTLAPPAIKNMSRAVLAETKDGVRDRDGALLYDPTIWEAVGYGAGFMPAKLSDEYSANTLAREEAVYWTRRRETLLKLYQHEVLQGGSDPDKLGEIVDRIIDFNAAAPDSKLVISTRTLRKSVKAEAESVARREAGVGANKQTQEITRSARDLYNLP